jgi:hypothetical protein
MKDRSVKKTVPLFVVVAALRILPSVTIPGTTLLADAGIPFGGE